MIHTGDCVEVMAAMDAASVDAIVTDPPYGLEFMGKEWDSLNPYRRGNPAMNQPQKPKKSDSNWTVTYGTPNRIPRCRKCGKQKFNHPKSRCQCVQPDWDMEGWHHNYGMQQWHETWAREALRVAKPGAYLLAFGGTRTYHRLACAIEDAGWIIRDCLVWAYASGFPKSRALLKPAWEPIVMARKPGPLRELAIDACRIGTTVETWPATRSYAPGRMALTGHGEHVKQESGPMPAGRWPANVVLTDPIFDGGVDGVVGGGVVTMQEHRADPAAKAGTMFGGGPKPTRSAEYGDTGTYSRFFLIPKSSRSDREPTDPSHAYRLHRERGECDKLGAWDSADQSLVEQMDSTSPERDISEDIEPDDSLSSMSPSGSPLTDPSPRATKSTTSTAISRTTDSITSSSLTRLPISDSTPGVSYGAGNGGSPADSAESSSLWTDSIGISAEGDGRPMAGAEPAKSRAWWLRNNCGVCGKRLPRVSTHPTQKPTDLMRHLVRLVTPMGGVVLDPFLGSGTTAIAAEMEGFAWLGIEREAEYVAIAEARLQGVQKGMAL